MPIRKQSFTMPLSQDATYLTGHCLIAMPGMEDERFDQAVVYLCNHSDEGAMGVVVNREMPDMDFAQMLEQLNIPCTAACDAVTVHYGGPVEPGRGFVVHSADYMTDSSIMVDDRRALTATVDILRAIAEGRGPMQSILTLGYAGWGADQLEHEIRHNAWLIVPADDELLFGKDHKKKWQRAVEKLGIDLAMLSSTSGSA
jgi:putative transcriptional regulator